MRQVPELGPGRAVGFGAGLGAPPPPPPPRPRACSHTRRDRAVLVRGSLPAAAGVALPPPLHRFPPLMEQQQLPLRRFIAPNLAPFTSRPQAAASVASRHFPHCTWLPLFVITALAGTSHAKLLLCREPKAIRGHHQATATDARVRHSSTCAFSAALLSSPARQRCPQMGHAAAPSSLLAPAAAAAALPAGGPGGGAAADDGPPPRPAAAAAATAALPAAGGLCCKRSARASSSSSLLAARSTTSP